MKARITDKYRCGVYMIKNKINNKVYIGQSSNIYNRIIQHCGNLTLKRTKSANDFLIEDWHIYGKTSFEYMILEDINSTKDKSYKQERENYWMKLLKSTNREFGYNLRQDTLEGLICLESTRKKMSESGKKNYANPEYKEKMKKIQQETMNINKAKPEWIANMSSKVSKAKRIHIFKRLHKETLIVLQVYQDLEEILNENPKFKWQNIYAACNGNKPSAYGYKWQKELKI